MKKESLQEYISHNKVGAVSFIIGAIFVVASYLVFYIPMIPAIQQGDISRRAGEIRIAKEAKESVK